VWRLISWAVKRRYWVLESLAERREVMIVKMRSRAEMKFPAQKPKDIVDMLSQKWKQNRKVIMWGLRAREKDGRQGREIVLEKVQGWWHIAMQSCSVYSNLLRVTS
jgi:hypothetical protein